MIPGARVAAAIEILDDVLSGTAAEKALTGWARRSRFAGSKDRAAVRDHVFDALRNMRRYAQVGSGTWPASGRDIMIGAMRCTDVDTDTIFSGIGHAPFALEGTECDTYEAAALDLWNLPDDGIALFKDQLGQDAETHALALSERAPITIRTHATRTDRPSVQHTLAADGFETRLNPLSDTALTLTGKTRGLVSQPAYIDGLFEMQDAGSQALVDQLALSETDDVFDYCAGGGGKALAIAARFGCAVSAHDVNFGRMKDLPERADRAEARIRVLPEDHEFNDRRYDCVLLDVPCSGSGSWRRAPDAKWRFTQQDLDALCQVQSDILDKAHPLVCQGGTLVYATCSVFPAENSAQVQQFVVRNPEWRCNTMTSWPVSVDGDGFFMAQLQRQ